MDGSIDGWMLGIGVGDGVGVWLSGSVTRRTPPSLDSFLPTVLLTDRRHDMRRECKARYSSRYRYTGTGM